VIVMMKVVGIQVSVVQVLDVIVTVKSTVSVEYIVLKSDTLVSKL